MTRRSFLPGARPATLAMDRQIVRETAERVLRNDEMAASELENAAEFLRQNPRSEILTWSDAAGATS